MLSPAEVTAGECKEGLGRAPRGWVSARYAGRPRRAGLRAPGAAGVYTPFPEKASAPGSVSHLPEGHSRGGVAAMTLPGPAPDALLPTCSWFLGNFQCVVFWSSQYATGCLTEYLCACRRDRTAWRSSMLHPSRGLLPSDSKLATLGPLFLLSAVPHPPGFQDENVMHNSCKDWEAVKSRSERDAKYKIYM